MSDDVEWRRLGEECFHVKYANLKGSLPLGYEIIEEEPRLIGNSTQARVILQVGKGTMFCGRPIHHTYWKFHGWRKNKTSVASEERVYFGDWYRTDEMAPGWGGPATIGFSLLLGDEVFDEDEHETDWDVAEEELPYIIEEILRYLGDKQ